MCMIPVSRAGACVRVCRCVRLGRVVQEIAWNAAISACEAGIHMLTSGLLSKEGHGTHESHDLTVTGNQWQLALLLLNQMQLETLSPDNVSAVVQVRLPSCIGTDMLLMLSCRCKGFVTSLSACKKGSDWQLALGLLRPRSRVTQITFWSSVESWKRWRPTSGEFCTGQADDCTWRAARHAHVWSCDCCLRTQLAICHTASVADVGS